MTDIKRKTKAIQRPDRNGWTPARRLAQAKRSRASRPWLKSTGPKTVSGRTASSRNAVKSDHAQKLVFKQVNAALRQQNEFLKLYLAYRYPSPGPTKKGPRFTWAFIEAEMERVDVVMLEAAIALHMLYKSQQRDGA